MSKTSYLLYIIRKELESFSSFNPEVLQKNVNIIL